MGMNSVSPATPERSLGTTYEIGAPPPLQAISKRLERWRLQAVARSVLPDERVATCLRHLIPFQNFVNVWKAAEKAHYSGLLVCGSIWICPVCAAKISERRRIDLLAGIESWKRQGGEVLMLTLTVPHYDYQPLREVLGGFTRSRRLFRHRKTWKTLSSAIGLRGSVRALEVTWGENGWHVHSHELLFLSPGREVSIDEIESRALFMWKSACGSAGMSEPNGRGVRIHDGSYAGKYAGKWGLECEITKGHIKAGRDGNYSPWDLLRGIEQGNQEWRTTFTEYAKAFRGKHQLEWSKGLRELLGLGVAETDEEIAKKIEEEAVLLGQLTRNQWRLVLQAEKRGELLEIAAVDGWSGVLRFIGKLVYSGKCPF